MRISGIIFVAAIFVSLLSHQVSAQDIERANEAGEEFQRQMPYSKDKPQSGETPGQAQPRDYISPPEREQPRSAPAPQGSDYPLCYNPYTRTYEYCYPEDSENFRLRFRSPDFRFWWESGRTCPPGYYFKPGWGCYRH